MHDIMFKNQGALTVENLKSYAGQISLDQAKFDSCLDNGDMKAEVTKDFEAGTSSGVQGTPAFIIGGEQISGAQPFDAFKAIIDKKLAEV
jgi:protein-disulfide isomerase